MARLSDQWLETLRSRVDIVDIVGEYVTLKPRGNRFWGLCPFHHEKTPSFSVDQNAQMYYCFGCHKGGTVFNFLMEQDHMEFMDAVKVLAERAHMEIPDTRASAEDEAESRATREKIYEANKAAAMFYHKTLWTEEGAAALAYLHKRGLDDSAIRHFGLGSTSSGWDALTRELLSKGFTMDILQKAWLSNLKDGRSYDMFRDRVMFPIIDGQSHVLGFGGRVLGNGEPKYLNTADTPVFNKRNGVYAMNFLRQERGLSRVILVEGYMDVVSLRKQGVPGVVATLGTALTEQQAHLLKRFAPEIVVAYDGDSAGQKAIWRALDIFEKEEAACRVLVFPDGQDPDEFISAHGKAAFDSLTPLDPITYRCRSLKEQYDFSTEDGRTNYAIACCEILRKVRNPVELENHIKRLMMDTGFEREVLLRQVGVQPKETAALQRREARYVRKEEEKESGCADAEKTLLMLLGARMIPTKTVRAEDFETPLYEKMAQALIDGVSSAALLDKLSDEERDRAARVLYVEAVPEEKNAMIIAEDCMLRIRVYRMEREITKLKEQLPGMQGEERRAGAMRIVELTRQIEEMRNSRKEHVV